MNHNVVRGPGRLATALLVVVSVLLVPSLVAASPPSGTNLTAARHVTVETYNLELGADLKPIFTAPDLPTLVGAAAAGYAEVVANNFPERATAIAALIAKERPDVVGLQEAALWQTSSTGPYGSYSTSYDYVALLVAALKAQKVPYDVAVENPNFVGQAPVTADFVNWVRYTDRNVILVRSDRSARQLSTGNPQQGVYAARIPIPLPPPLPSDSFITRGWASIDVTTFGRTFRFFTTHLEAYAEVVRNYDAMELVGLVAGSPVPVVVTGDINSRPTGCIPANENTVAYSIIAGAGLAEVWPAVHQQSPCTGFTSGQATLLDPANSLDHRIDDVFYAPASFTAIQAEIVGEEQRDRSVPTGFWPSDHASTVATLRMTNWAS